MSDLNIVKFTDQTDEMAQLAKKLAHANEMYRNTGRTEMSDFDYDKQLAVLKQMEDAAGFKYDISPTELVGAALPDNGLVKVKHEYPTLSLDKKKYADREELVEWASQSPDGVVMSWKCDGLTVVFTYDNGKLTRAVTHGNGNTGEGDDITFNAKYFKGVPAEIPYKEHLIVRAETVMTFAEFNRINSLLVDEDPYSNPRNLGNSTAVMPDQAVARSRELEIKSFQLVHPAPQKDAIIHLSDGTAYDMQYVVDRMNFVEALGFGVVERELCDASAILQKIDEWQTKIPNLTFPTDGLVFAYNDAVFGDSLGYTGHHVRGSIALKWTDELVPTVIRDIEWSTGPTGAITPVAVVDERKMGIGSMVSRASLHNLSIMKKLGIKKNCPVNMYMANMIIPQIHDCTPIEGAEEFEIPATCPACGHPTHIVHTATTAMLYCENPNCPAQVIGKLANTFSKQGLNVQGLSEKTIEFLIKEHYVESALDFYRLKDQGNGCGVLKKDMSGPALEDQLGWEVKSVDNLLSAIEKSRDTTLQKFLYSLNIPLLGNDLSKKLSKFFHGDINGFIEFVQMAHNDKQNAMDILTSIEGIGLEKATNIVDWADEVSAYRERWEDFMALVQELHFPDMTVPEDKDNSLEGITFVITGSVHVYHNRDEFKESVEARGGKVAGSVSKLTNYLVNNDTESTSSKNKKAKSLNIPIISEDEFIAKFGK